MYNSVWQKSKINECELSLLYCDRISQLVTITSNNSIGKPIVISATLVENVACENLHARCLLALKNNEEN